MGRTWLAPVPLNVSTDGRPAPGCNLALGPGGTLKSPIGQGGRPVFGINDRLRQREKTHGPIRVAVIGIGSMGGPLIDQITMAPGMTVDVVADLNTERAARALKDAGIPENAIAMATTEDEARRAIAGGKVICTSQSEIAWSLDAIDCV